MLSGTEVAALRSWRGQARPRSRARRRASPVVLIDSEASEGSTVVEVRADDELGLMYVITHTLAGLDLNISFATIATEKSRALDVFYVTDADGDKLAPERAAEVERALHDALRTFPRGAGAACPAGS
jgi:[protein-PII] uridylyltransferase